MNELNLERLLYYTRNPQRYFKEVQGSKARYKTYLERILPRSQVGRALHHPHSNPVYDAFVKQDYKKHYHHSKNDSVGANYKRRVRAQILET